MKAEISKGEVIAIFVVSLLVVVFFWDHIIMYPFKLYTTAIHESWHALAAILTGGEVVSITLSNNGSGMATTRGGIFIFISSAGYLGSALTAGLLIATSKRRQISEFLVFLISGVVLVLTFIYIEHIISIPFLIAVGFSVTLILLAWKTDYDSLVAIILGTLLAVDGVQDVKKYVLHIPYQTDAGILARQIGMEALTLPIAILFATICISIWFLSIRYVLKHHSN